MSFRVLRLLAIVSVLVVLSVAPVPAGASDTHDGYIPTDTGKRDATRSAVATPPPITFPVEGPVTYTDSFGACRSGCDRGHEGNDLMGDKLQRLLAANDSTVVWLKETATPDGQNSNYLMLEDDAGWQYWYIHINNDSPGTDDGANPAEWRFAPGIGIGSRVQAGQHIAYMGDSGNAEWTAPHVHFEIREPGGTAVDPYDSLQNARHFVLGESTEPPIVADIDDDPAAEILIYNPGSAADHRYDAAGETGVFDRGAISVHGTYDPLVGDFDANGFDDVVWYAPGRANDYIWWHGPDGSVSTPTTINGTYEPLVGDFDQNGFDDILWYAPGAAADYVWWYDADGHRSEQTRITGTYTPVVGDFDDNGFEDILWYAPGSAQDYLWSYHEDGYLDQRRTINGRYFPVVGDFDANGHADIYWYAEGAAPDYLWRHEPDHSYVSTREDQVEGMRVGSGDLDGDGRGGLVWFGSSGDEPVDVWTFEGDRFEATPAIVND
ncbi:MAG: VCBS repeat domain-containing M23 family metallopeptidase [Acidimicrobiales bacterium]|nr:VCBS repeat domain-containing M23 family metallopeptidase [Acidimicrobiales bacterium]